MDHQIVLEAYVLDRRREVAQAYRGAVAQQTVTRGSRRLPVPGWRQSLSALLMTLAARLAPGVRPT